MSATDLPWVITDRLEAEEIPFMIVGAYATLAFGAYRTTDDLDIVLGLTPGDWGRFARAFPEEDFYRPPRETFLEETARSARGHFNVIHLQTMNRGDCYLAGTDPLQHWGLRTRRPIEMQERRCWVAPPELVILKKLEFFREGESRKHVRDIEGILRLVPDLDRAFIEEHVERLGLREQWLVCQPDAA